MPELPEVETTRRGIAPHIIEKRIKKAIIRNPNLRWPVTENMADILKGQVIKGVDRRGKYLLLSLTEGTLLLHLGMSGHLHLLESACQPQKHDHIDILFEGGLCLRFRDPRRFGCFIWTKEAPYEHPLLKSLGYEPLSNDFNGTYLWNASRDKKVAVKNFIMDSHILVGVGNIYATESLFSAGIHPKRAAGRISKARYDALAKAIKAILKHAIEAGGTTLKDFLSSEGKPGYFKQALKVYGRAGEPCVQCGTNLSQCRLGQRGTVYCSQCQT